MSATIETGCFFKKTGNFGTYRGLAFGGMTWYSVGEFRRIW